MRSDVVRIRRASWFTGLAAAISIFATPLPQPAPDVLPYTGKIEGHVRDKAGAPIPSAQVRIDGTEFGGVTDARGYYFINNVPAGVIDLTASFVGFKMVRVEGLRVNDGYTTVQDYALEAQAVDIGDIEVVAATSTLVPRDEVVTRQRTSGDPLPTDQVAGVLSLQPGVVVNRDGGLNIRGKRDDEAATYIDGVPVSPGNRGFAFTPAAPPPPPAPVAPQVGVSSFQDASVTTGSTSAFGNATSTTSPAARHERPNTEEYKPIYENRFLASTTNPLSTFSIDVDAASYSNSRRFLMSRTRPLPDAVRIEEFINYFEYPYPDPVGRHPFSVTLEEHAAPWNPEHRLVLIGLQAKRLSRAELPASNLVFLIDVSGSMGTPDKLPLVKKAFGMLVEQLRPQDRVAIVVYAGAAGLVLPSTSGAEKDAILASIDRLSSGGSTAGGAGIQLAYKTAAENYLRQGNNRVILATDGDFNVGASSEAELVRMIEEYRTQGTYLTVLGFGTGNYKDSRMEQLADKGNGNYAYVDNEREARKVFVNQLAGTLLTVAKDVKLQVEFNPARVASYRLIGYENRVLAKEDFNDDRKDAGEMGAGHSVTALYEIVPTRDDLSAAPKDTLRYQILNVSNRRSYESEMLTVKLRYKRPTEDRSRLFQESLTTSVRPGRMSETFNFASAVAEFGLLLRNSEHKGQSSSAAVIERASSAIGDDRLGIRSEFVDLVRRWQEITGEGRNRGD